MKNPFKVRGWIAGRSDSGLFHAAVRQKNAAALDGLPEDDAIAPLYEKGLGRQGCIGGEGPRVAVPLQKIAQCRCNALPLIILMDIEPVEVACRVHIRKADYLFVSQRHKTVMRREGGVPALTAYAGCPCPELFRRVVRSIDRVNGRAEERQDFSKIGRTVGAYLHVLLLP